MSRHRLPLCKRGSVGWSVNRLVVGLCLSAVVKRGGAGRAQPAGGRPEAGGGDRGFLLWALAHSSGDPGIPAGCAERSTLLLWTCNPTQLRLTYLVPLATQ